MKTKNERKQINPAMFYLPKIAFPSPSFVLVNQKCQR